MTLTTDIPSFAPRTALGAASSWTASRLRRWLDRVSERRQIKLLLDCDDHVLNDIGVSRAELQMRLRRRFG